MLLLIGIFIGIIGFVTGMDKIMVTLFGGERSGLGGGQ